MEKEKLTGIKNQWRDEGFLGGAVICDFLLMNKAGKDIVFDHEDELVQEYIALLYQRLESENYNLALMVNTEIEKCMIDKNAEIYTYLNDEIYEHFKNNHEEYPVQAVGLHIDAIMALARLYEPKTVYKYLWTIKETYQKTFGDKSFLFCKNWCHIINEIMIPLIPDAAIEEFEDNVELFSNVLREEFILYTLCLAVAAAKANREQKIEYSIEASNLCKTWSESIPAKKRIEVQRLVQGMVALCCRNRGEYDLAVEQFRELLGVTEDLPYKLYILSQIATVLLVKNSWKELGDFFNEYRGFIDTLQEPDENAAELYSIDAMYNMSIGNYRDAEILIEKAIKISTERLGEESDKTIKFESNRLLIRYNMGEFEECGIRIQELLDIVLKKPGQYPESMPYILNNLTSMTVVDRITGDTVSKIKKAFNSKGIKYDAASNIIFKSNLYFTMMATGDEYEEENVNELRKELQGYFKRYPNSDGYLQYLEGEFGKLCKENNVASAYEVLGIIERLLGNKELNINTKEYFLYFTVRLKILLYKRNYMQAKKWLLNSWKNILLPLFKILLLKKEDNILWTRRQLFSYISLVISAASQCMQLKITKEELYEYVLNFKYYEDLFYCNRLKLESELQTGKWYSIKDIKIQKRQLLIEYFTYRKYDLVDERLVFETGSYGWESSTHLICFCLNAKTGFLTGSSVDIISNISYEGLGHKMSGVYDQDNISPLEKETRETLEKYTVNKERIYVCSDIFRVQVPLGAMRMGKKQYWGEAYQIIYCNSGKDVNDVKDDIEIQNFSNSIFCGMSLFDGDREMGGDKMYMHLADLSYTELEIKKSGELTGGEAYLNEDMSRILEDKQRKEIIHLATHAAERKNDKKFVLIVGKSDTGQYITLNSEEIAKMDWSGVKLAVFSACRTNEESWDVWGRDSFSQAARKAGAMFSISTEVEVQDGVNTFFMVCFYKKLFRHKKIIKAFFEALKTMRTITKQEILKDEDYRDIEMEHYLEDYTGDSRPFESADDWAVYTLQMNGNARICS